MKKYPSDLKQLADQYRGKRTSNLTRWKPPIYFKLLEWTNFLPESSTASQRLFHVEQDLFEIPKCKNCDNTVKWINAYKPSRYADFCSSKCVASNEDTINKKKETFQKHYGVDSYSQTEEFKNKIKSIDHEVWQAAIEKRKQTSLQRYGVEHAYLTDEARDKRAKTNLKKFGHTNVLASEYVKNIKRKKYGTESYVKVPEFQEKRKKTMLERYGVEYSGQSKILEQKRIDTIVEKYRVSSYSHIHLSERTLKLLNDKEWLYEQHHIKKRTITDIAISLQVDKNTISNYFRDYDIPILNFPKSTAEKELSQFLTDHKINHETNIRSLIPPYELDIYIPEQNIAIEYCGLYWHSTAIKETPNYHLNKMILCNQNNIRLITIFEDEWVHKPNIIKDKILYTLNKNKESVYARKCTIEHIDSKTKQNFFEENHIQGGGPSSINLALTYNNEIVACMAFIKQNNDYILNRYATSQRVVGGFSKLLKYFQKQYDWDQIITFADLRWSDGNLYEKTGFTLHKILAPDYYYVDLQNIQRIHKFNFRHKNLPNILKDYDPSLSELENTLNNNWFRIYNCGLKRYTMQNK